MTPSRATTIRCAELVLQAYATNAPRPMIAPIDGGIALVFAGTRCAQDVITDAMSYQLPRSWSAPAEVHAGFSAITDDAWRACVDAVCGLDISARIVVTGHSLGAAAAVLMAFRLRWSIYAERRPIEVVTFGCPRVGDRRFHAEYRARQIPTLRIYRDWDPVASAPAWWGWRHVGDSLHLTRHGVPIADPTTPWGKLRRLLEWRVGNLDHSMTGYHAALQAHNRRGFEWPN